MKVGHLLREIVYHPYKIPGAIDYHLGKVRAKHEFGVDGRVSLTTIIPTPSSVTLADDVSIMSGSFISAGGAGTVSIGTGSSIRRHVHLVGNIDIGNNVMIAAKSGLFAHNHGKRLGSVMQNQPLEEGTITIGDDVWIGSNAVITPNVELETGSVVGAGAVVTDDVPANTIVGGNPARKIQKRQP